MKSFVCYAFNSQEIPPQLLTEIQRLGGEVSTETAPVHKPVLMFKEGRLVLTSGDAQGHPLQLDYQSKYESFISRSSAPKGPLAKALGLGKKANLTVHDGMLGAASDSLLMLSWGLNVHSFERVPEIYLLNWFQYQYFKKLYPDLHFQISYGDVRDSKGAADVLYLDPMYPQTRNKRLSKKEMQFFNQVAGKDSDEQEVFEWAMEQDYARAVIKRPLKADVFKIPTHSFESKAIRYDMYSFRQLS